MTATVFGFDDGHVFVTEQTGPRADAWGQYGVEGALFDTVAGTVQTGAVATCNFPATVLEIVAGVGAAELGASLTRGVTL